MHLLLTNDDGFDSPLLALCCRAVAARGHRVSVCAPARQQSAKSHAFTVSEPLRVIRDTMPGAQDAWRVEGTPVDSLRLGLLSLTEAPVDVVLSGINAGWNLGLATWVSGTVGAAREAAFHGVPALALSAADGEITPAVAFFADWGVRLAERLPGASLPPCTLVNVNLPDCAVQDLQTPQLCPLSLRVYEDGYERRCSPRGDTYFWLEPERPCAAPEPGSDQALIRDGHLTVSLLGPQPVDAAAWQTLLKDL